LNNEDASELALSIIFYYFWILFYLFFIFAVLTYASLDAFTSTGWTNAKTFLSSTGAYRLIAFISWIPHVLRRLLHSHLSAEQDVGLILPLYITGILYGLLCIWDPSMIELPDKTHVRNSTIEFKMSDLVSSTNNPLGDEEL
jgi:hypothetical protein